MVSSCRNNGTISQELRYPFTGAVVQFWQESSPLSIECDENGEIRTRVFYCDPQRPDQKGGCEVTHEMIRRILPKGTSFDHLTQSDIDLMMSHINSYARKKLNNQSPYQLFSFFYGEDLLSLLHINQISPNDINLTPKLLKR